MQQRLRKFGKIIFGRTARNIVFWLLFTVYHGVPEDNFWQNYVVLLTVIFVSYGIPGYINNFLLIPRYLVKRRYGFYFLFFIPLLLLTAVVSYYLTHLTNSLFPTINYMGNLKDVAMLYHVFPSALLFVLLAMGKFTSDAITNQHKLEELETQKLASELESLKSQINPHFIFNALNTIYGLARRDKPMTAEAVIKLSDILRYVLYDCDVERIGLDQEILFIKQYVDFARLRSHYDTAIEMEIDAPQDSYSIAPLLLLPLIENAIKHGMAKQVVDPWVKMQLVVKDGNLYFNCANSNYNKTDMTLSTSSGIGLRNVKRRLELVYPKQYLLEIEDTDTFFRLKLVLYNI